MYLYSMCVDIERFLCIFSLFLVDKITFNDITCVQLLCPILTKKPNLCYANIFSILRIFTSSLKKLPCKGLEKVLKYNTICLIKYYF